MSLSKSFLDDLTYRVAAKLGVNADLSLVGQPKRMASTYNFQYAFDALTGIAQENHDQVVEAITNLIATDTAAEVETILQDVLTADRSNVRIRLGSPGITLNPQTGYPEIPFNLLHRVE